MATPPKISAGAKRTLNNLLEKADDYAFLGASHPDAQDDIEAAYERAILAMRKLINRLETNQTPKTYAAIKEPRK